jgi:hypothetical protein
MRAHPSTPDALEHHGRDDRFRWMRTCAAVVVDELNSPSFHKEVVDCLLGLEGEGVRSSSASTPHDRTSPAAGRHLRARSS